MRKQKMSVKSKKRHSLSALQQHEHQQIGHMLRHATGNCKRRIKAKSRNQLQMLHDMTNDRNCSI